MAASKNRIDWSLLCLRLAVGGMAFLAGFEPLMHAALPANLAQATHWAWHLAEMLCGIFMLLGLWMPIASLGLTLIIGWPLLQGWLHGAAFFGNLQGLFLLLVAFASALGGAGKWALGRG
jgi:uncharacterized membrane protein YphA (DoxX/SURF4 family)